MRLPLMISVTITDRSGRTLSGQTSRRLLHLDPPRPAVQRRHQLRARRPRHAPLHRRARRASPSATSAATRTPACPTPSASTTSAARNRRAARATSPTAASSTSSAAAAARRRITSPPIAAAVAGAPPRPLPAASWLNPVPAPVADHYSQFSGLESLTIRPDSNFLMIGERTNVTGSAKFARLIKSGNYTEAVSVALEQVRGGANIIDVNMDEGMLDSEQAMTTFLNFIATEPEIARVPVMIDSSKWIVHRGRAEVRAGQGRRQLDQPQGRRGRLPRQGPHRPPLRRRRRRHGVRRDRPGRHRRAQGGDLPARLPAARPSRPGSIRPTSSSTRTSSPSPPGSRSTTTTRSTSSRRRGMIKAACPGVKISGGVSNLSFSFRGNDVVREAIHSAFLYHAIQAGMDMGIVNAGQLVVYEDIPKDLLEHVEDIIFNRRPDATERLVQFAETVKGSATRSARPTSAGARRTVEKRLSHALVHGVVDFIEADVEEARQQYAGPARDHRRAADGRHEDRRRPVRRRQDVPAAGRQERPGDEEGGRLPAAVHGGAQAPDRRRLGPGQDPDGHRQGRRPRHRQEHRRRRARLQQLRGHRPRRDGPGGEDPRRGDRAQARHHRAERPDHAVARRDGRSSPGDGAPRHSRCRC